MGCFPPVCLVLGKNTNPGYLRGVLLSAKKRRGLTKKCFTIEKPKEILKMFSNSYS